MTSIEVTGVKGNKLTLWLWTEKKKNLLNMCSWKIHYKIETSEYFDETLEIELQEERDGKESIPRVYFGRVKESKG